MLTARVEHRVLRETVVLRGTVAAGQSVRVAPVVAAEAVTSAGRAAEDAGDALAGNKDEAQRKNLRKARDRAVQDPCRARRGGGRRRAGFPRRRGRPHGAARRRPGRRAHWTVRLGPETTVRAAPVGDGADGVPVDVVAASPGALRAGSPAIWTGCSCCSPGAVR
ncbi:hypothetical protein ACH4A8_26610 [Streptomyces vietnamensis]|uniref:hypothetical protein n=1 Tax=Streptomyces vietnamensis TaxID=362257 RepID=UPI0037B2506A